MYLLGKIKDHAAEVVSSIVVRGIDTIPRYLALTFSTRYYMSFTNSVFTEGLLHYYYYYILR